MQKCFEGLRVIDLSTYIAAPICGRILADLGAEVIKVEPTKGEIFRSYGKVGWGLPATEDNNIVFDIFNSNKKSLPINMKDEKGKEIMDKLLASADVFLTNTRAQALVKLGLDYETLSKKYPKLIFATILGYGEKGPEKDAPGYDTIAFWSRSGFVADQSVEGHYPVVLPGGFGDCATGTTLFGAVAAALYNREKTGKGDKVDVSLYGTALWFAGYTSSIAQPGNDIRYPKGRYEGNPMQYEYKTKDGVWLALGLVDFARDFNNFAEIIGKPEWVNNPDYCTRPAMDKHNVEGIKTLEEKFAEHDYAYWDEKLKEKDIVHTNLKHYKETLMDPQALANDYSQEFQYPTGTRYVPKIPMHLANSMPKEFTAAPLLGADTVDLLTQLGYSKEEIAALDESGATVVHK